MLGMVTLVATGPVGAAAAAGSAVFALLLSLWFILPLLRRSPGMMRPCAPPAASPSS